MSRREAAFVLAVVAVGVGVQVAFGVSGSGGVRPIVLALIALALLGLFHWVRGKRRNP